MSTITRTYTKTDIHKAFECFRADLIMLARRTQAIDIDHAHDYAHDITLMAEAECLEKVHIHLYDGIENLIRVHEYSVHTNIDWDTQRPGVNNWPCCPEGRLTVIVSYSDITRAENLKSTGKLQISWSRSELSTNYSGMRSDPSLKYASNSYGLQRNSYSV